MSELDLGDLAVVHRSDTEVILVKPAGMPAEMRADTHGRSLLARVQGSGWPESRLPHRLDAVTGGLQVVARDADAVAWHNRAIEARTWTKRYVARIDAAHGAVAEQLLGEHHRYLRRRGRVSTVVRSGGQPATLIIEAMAADPGRPDCTQVLVRLVTGRYHQIRVMLSDLGAPLVGDERYGGRTDRGGPWLEHAELTLPLPGREGPTRLVVPERRFAWADAIEHRLAGGAGPRPLDGQDR